MEIEKIRELAQIMEEFGLTGLKIEENDTKICLEMKGTEGRFVGSDAVPMKSSTGFDIGQRNNDLAYSQPNNSQTERALSPNRVDYTEVKSPMVGVFYSAPSPKSDPFVTVGTRVEPGDILCIIEAMKLMNEITAEQGGIITELCVENGEIVEAGQTLFRMETIE